MLTRIITVIFCIIILFNFTNISIILNELAKKNTNNVNNEIRVGYILEDDSIKGYSVSEYQNNNERIALFIKDDTYFTFDQLNFKTILETPLISIPNNEDEIKNKVIISFNINEDERKRILLDNGQKKISIIEFPYSQKIHNKFKQLFQKLEYNSFNIYEDLIKNIKSQEK
ncbi:hypothetical protein CPAV1605_1617 [seawater metagenome]|uniref:Uncharacterized protein n=1 Tax=seawater metagenome TaxID=1561972 RepID=A0A5E8CKF7_9ZZZZ